LSAFYFHRNITSTAKKGSAVVCIVLLAGTVAHLRQNWLAENDPNKISTYCRAAETLLRKHWDPTVTEDVKVNLDVDKNGNFLNVELADTSKGSKAVQQNVLNNVIKLHNLGHPPRTTFPLKLSIFNCAHHNVEVTRRDIDFGPYIEDVQKRIRSAWYPLRREKSNNCKVTFKVSRDGDVSEVKIVKSSGDKEVDAAGEKAVNSASPFEPLPPGSPCSADIEFTFDYNVHKGYGSWFHFNWPWTGTLN
jgi:TonB family protein